MTMLVSPFRSLRVRLIASVVIIEVVMLSLLVWSNMGVIQHAYADRLRDTAGSILKQIATTSGAYLLEVDYASLGEYLANIADQEELAYLAILDRDRRPVISLGDMPANSWPDNEAHPLLVNDGVFDLVKEIAIGKQSLGEVRIGFSTALMKQAIQAARLRSIAIAATEITLTVLVTVFIGIHLTRRLGRLANAAQRVGAGDYEATVATEVPDEVGMTAAAFNRMVTEVSERTRRLQAMLARERVIEETSIDGMITYGSDLNVLSANPAMTAMFGHDEKALLGQPVARLLEQTDARDGVSPWKTATATRQEKTGIRIDGSRFPLELYVGHVDIDGEPLYAATLHDITERKRAERECMTLLEGNRFLIHKSLAVQEEERRHLARELHDELGQCMTAIQADAEIIHELSGDAQAKIKTSANAILEISARIYDVVHSMMQRLRPSILDDLGLVAAIEEELEAWQQRYKKIDLDFDIEGDVSDLGESINISVYRIIQESLTNISKHSEATRVHVRLAVHTMGNDSHLELRIEDNGCGMDPARRTRGLGMLGMRERVEALGGSFRVFSSPGDGARIDADIPLSISNVA